MHSLSPNPIIFKVNLKMSRHFAKEDVQTATECMKKCSTSLLTRDIRIEPQ